MENTTQARTHADVSRLPWPENLCRQLPGKEKPFSPLSTWLVFNIAKFERAPWDGRGPVKRNTARKFNNRPSISVFCSLGAPMLPCADETLQCRDEYAFLDCSKWPISGFCLENFGFRWRFGSSSSFANSCLNLQLFFFLNFLLYFPFACRLHYYPLEFSVH